MLCFLGLVLRGLLLSRRMVRCHPLEFGETCTFVCSLQLNHMCIHLRLALSAIATDNAAAAAEPGGGGGGGMSRGELNGRPNGFGGVAPGGRSMPGGSPGGKPWGSCGGGVGDSTGLLGGGDWGVDLLGPVRSSGRLDSGSCGSGESRFTSSLAFHVSSSSDESLNIRFVRSSGILFLSAIIIMFWLFAWVIIVFTWFSRAAREVENGRDWGRGGAGVELIVSVSESSMSESSSFWEWGNGGDV